MLFQGRRFDRELEEEMQAHLEMQAEEYAENGMDRVEARYLIAAALLVAAASLLASFIPARRATRIDPADALRHE